MKISLKFILIILFFGFIQFSCQPAEQQNVQDIDAEKVKELLKTEELVLLDVRTPAEYQGGRIAGATLMNVNDDSFDSKANELDKSKPVVVYCAIGGRSTRASKKLREMGFTTIYNYKGGFSDWSSRGEPIEK